MTECVKKITLREVKKLKDSNVTEIDLFNFTTELQCLIIVNTSVGPRAAKLLVDYEQEDGSLAKISIAQAITRAL